ncbi:MAG: hypothetical protein HYT93_03120 [Parcubacteria group bacterium]|nr:hypothetical protein [Parcubacteria group bacterium]
MARFTLPDGEIPTLDPAVEDDDDLDEVSELHPHHDTSDENPVFIDRDIGRKRVDIAIAASC